MKGLGRFVDEVVGCVLIKSGCGLKAGDDGW